MTAASPWSLPPRPLSDLRVSERPGVGPPRFCLAPPTQPSINSVQTWPEGCCKALSPAVEPQQSPPHTAAPGPAERHSSAGPPRLRRGPQLCLHLPASCGPQLTARNPEECPPLGPDKYPASRVVHWRAGGRGSRLLRDGASAVVLCSLCVVILCAPCLGGRGQAWWQPGEALLAHRGTSGYFPFSASPW